MEAFMKKLRLSKKWSKKLKNMPETGMGYQSVKILLKDGRAFIGIVENSEFITKIKESDTIPFSKSDIKDIKLTHEKF